MIKEITIKASCSNCVHSKGGDRGSPEFCNKGKWGNDSSLDQEICNEWKPSKLDVSTWIERAKNNIGELKE